MIQTENKVKIEGILSEVEIRNGEFKQSGTGIEMPYLAGSIKVRVDQEINKQMTQCEIPIKFFAPKFTKQGKENPGYESVQNLEKMISLASAENEEQADRIRITTGSLHENFFYSKSGQFIQAVDINSNFFTKINKKDCHPEATFSAVICIGNLKEELDKEGLPTGNLIVEGILPQYGGRVDRINFKVYSQQAIEHINANWNQGDTVKVVGKINFSTITEYTEEVMGFGEPVVTAHTTYTNELIITSGSPCGLEGDAALDIREIQAALNERQTRILAEEKKQNNTPSTKDSFARLGF